MPSDATYCAITFAPVQGFIEKSRKLRDLYGSSFILSYLAATVCQAGEAAGWELISPALPNITKGTPNQIILKANNGVGAQRLRPDEWQETTDALRQAFEGAWQALVTEVRKNLETTTLTSQYTYTEWHDSWKSWGKYAWEWFCVMGQPGESITQVRQQINEAKRSRNWIGVNWQGESSTLSGSDAIAWPGMDRYAPKTELRSEREAQVNEFYAKLTRRWESKIIDEGERLSIPDLVKRLVTLPEIARKIEQIKDYPDIDLPERFADLNRHGDGESSETNPSRWTAWFMGDADKLGDYLKTLAGDPQEVEKAKALSFALVLWGDRLGSRITTKLTDPCQSCLVYAGGDDLLGVLYHKEIGETKEKFEFAHWQSFLLGFNSLWQEYGNEPNAIQCKERGIERADFRAIPAHFTMSMGLVWAAPGVPQREVLQHCRAAEKSAKSQGRNRVAIRILFNSGTHLEWACPWQLLEPILNSGCNWTHFQRDIATLQARHALEVPRIISEAEVKKHTKVAIAILQHHLQLSGVAKSAIADSAQWFNGEGHTGILGECNRFKCNKQRNRWSQVAQAFNDWVIALAHVGFRLAPGAQQLTQTESIAV